MPKRTRSGEVLINLSPGQESSAQAAISEGGTVCSNPATPGGDHSSQPLWAGSLGKGQLGPVTKKDQW